MAEDSQVPAGLLPVHICVYFDGCLELTLWCGVSGGTTRGTESVLRGGASQAGEAAEDCAGRG